ncbi:MAG: nucleotide disphospho-sugar-binding domain-containing protein [Solirubrobacteraceae bacterium]
MARVLAYTSPARGHLYPLVPILDELAGRGHEIAIRTLASQVTLMRDRGFAAAPIAPIVEGLVHDDYKAHTPQGSLRRGVAKFAARAQYEVSDLRAAIDAERPDLILVDAMSWGASAAAAAWEGPWAQWFPYPLPVPSPDVPPFGPGLRPASGSLGRLRDRTLRPLMLSSMEKAFLPSVNATRTSVAQAPFASITEMFTAAPLLLYMTGEPFEYPRSDWPASVRMVGPCCWDPPAEPPTWLAGIDQPIVLVSTSSEFQDDGRLVSTALQALADEDVHVVATIPAAEIPRAKVPANAHVEQFVPHAPILARAACAVTHGGCGVTQKALAARVPVCVVPFGRDQLEVARRVEVAQAGTRLPARRLNPDRLRAKIREAMTKHPGANRVADGFAATGGPTAAADAIETLRAGRIGESRQSCPAAATQLASQ